MADRQKALDAYVARVESIRRQAQALKTINIPDAGEGRVVHHFGDSVTQASIREHVGQLEFYRAVGYLSTWNMTFPEVKLYYDAKQCEITASYYTATGELGYCIGAVWNETTKQFGFHS